MLPHITGRKPRADQQTQIPSDGSINSRPSTNFSIDSAAPIERSAGQPSTIQSRFESMRLPSMTKNDFSMEQTTPASAVLWKALCANKNTQQSALLSSPFSTPPGYKTLLAETRRRMLDSHRPRDVFADSVPLTIPHRRDMQVSPLPSSAPPTQRQYAPTKGSGESPKLNLRDGVGVASSSYAAPPEENEAAEWLIKEEEARRVSVQDLEAWERRVVDDMMVVLFVTSVLKPALDDLLVQERNARGLIQLAESHAFHNLVHKTLEGKAVLAQLDVSNERKLALLRGTKRKVEKLHDNQTAVDRLIVNYIKKQTDPHNELDEKLQQLTGNPSIASTYPGMLHAKSAQSLQKELNAIDGTTIHMSPNPAPGFMPVILQRAHSPLPRKYAKAATSGASTSTYGVSHRSVQAQNTRVLASTMIAYLVELLEEHDRVSRLLFAAHEEQLADIMEHFHMEYQSMLEWQDRRLHLERLQYWRSNRIAAAEALESQSSSSSQVANSTPLGKHQPKERGECSQSVVHARSELNASLSSVSVAGHQTHRRVGGAPDLGTVIKEEGRQRVAIKVEEKHASHFLFAPVLASMSLASHSDQPPHASVFMVHRWQAADEFLRTYESIRCALLVDALRDKQQLLVPVYETLERHRVFEEVAAWHTLSARGQMAKLSQLVQYDTNASARAAVHTIQRAVRDRQRGRLGWRWTHKVIGEEIRAYRDDLIVQRGRQQLADMQRHLEDQLTVYAGEIAGEHRKAREEMEVREYQNRVQVTSNEAWDRSRIKGESIQHVLEKIIWPQIVTTVENEVLDRHRIILEEDEIWTADTTRLAELMRVTYRIIDFLYEEPEDRAGYEADQADEFDRLTVLEYDMRELVRIAADEEEQRQESARVEFMENAIEQKVTFFTKRVEPALERLCNDSQWTAAVACNVELPLRVQKESTYRWFLHGRVKLIAALMLDIHRGWLNVLFSRHCYAVYGPNFMPLLTQEEQNDRDAITTAEAAQYATLIKPVQKLNWEVALRTDRRRKAGLVIWNFYRQYKRGNVGISGMRKTIRRYIIEPRDRCATDKQRLTTRNDIQGELERLQTAEDEEMEAVVRMYEEARERLQLISEPQSRGIVASREAMIRRIMEQNLVALVDDLARTALDVVVEQREPYFRSRIEMEREEELYEWAYPLFQRVHTATKSSYARIIQRAWRAHCDRSNLHAALETASWANCRVSGEDVDELLMAESSDRNCIEVDEYESFTFDSAVPFLHGATLLAHTTKDVERMFLTYMMNQTTTSELSDEELTDRVRILSLMHSDRADLEIRRKEKLERAKITLFDAVHSVMRIRQIEEERFAREELWKERCTFLLRVLLLAEAALRTDVCNQETTERNESKDESKVPRNDLDEL